MLVAGASDDCPIFFVRLAWHLGQVSCVVDMEATDENNICAYDNCADAWSSSD
jgi:hypothetical protein